MPPTLLYKLINNLKEMRHEDSQTHHLSTSLPRHTSFSSGRSNQKSILLDNIKDQQIYLCLTNTLLRMAQEAGASQNALEEVGRSLLTARGYHLPKLLANTNQPQDPTKKRRESYNWLERGTSYKEQQALLAKVQHELVQARQRQSHYKCLIKYKSQKQDQIAPNTSASPASRKERFKRMIKERIGVRSIESSNFYKYQVNQILQNSFKYQNQCYRTIASFSHLKTMFGHSSDNDMDNYSQIFNAIFDKNQNLILTGGEEGLIKVWHKNSGTLITNLKGHTDYLNKIDTSLCNKYLLSSGGDGLRFFNLSILKPLGGWRDSSIIEIASFTHNHKVIFLFGDNSHLYALTQDTMLAKAEQRLQLSDFYQFYFGDIISKDDSPILVISLSPSKTHILLGLQSGQMLLVHMTELLLAINLNKPGEQLTLPCLLPVRAHSEQIIEIKWSNSDYLWATGAKDGRCCIWELRNDEILLINHLTVGAKGTKGRKKRNNYSCSYICWNCNYSHFAAGFQENIEEEDNERGHGEVLVYNLRERRVTCELSRDVSQQYGGIRAMDAHPYYPNILLICEAEGNIILFDIFIGCVVNAFQERGYHILHPQFQLIPTECHFSKDGLSFIVATEYGSISIYGYDSKIFYTTAPTEQFLKTDFQQFRIEDNTLRAIPHTLQFEDDINYYPKGDILNVRGQPHPQTVKVDTASFLAAINNPAPIIHHLPEIKIDPHFLKIIAHNLKENERQQQFYSKTYDEIERMKQLVLFHERERQFLVVQGLTNQKIKTLKAILHPSQHHQQKHSQMIEEAPVSKRKLHRHAQRQRINYSDDFQYNDSQEEDYNEGEQFPQAEIPEELGQSFSEDIEDQDEMPKMRRRQNRIRIRRVTRRSNYQEVEDNYGHQSHNQPERIVRKRRRQVSQQLDQNEVQNQPKKKQKIDQQQSQNRGYSRLRKQFNQSNNNPPSEQASDCFRCQLVKATQFCYKCDFSQQFCDDCSSLRGRKIRDRFHCIICLYLNNKSEEDHQHVSEQLYRATSRNDQCYIPQLEDQVRYFFQGYQEFLVQYIGKLNTFVYKNNQSFRLLPHTQDVSLINTPLCRVESIEYYFPMKQQTYSMLKRNPGKGQKSNIMMLVGLKPVEQGQMFWVFYDPGQEFLLLQSIYSQIREKDLISKLNINDLITMKQEQMQIVQIGPIEDRFPQSIWKLIKIRKTEGKRLRGNTKDIQRRINIWKLSEQIQAHPINSSIEEKYFQRLLQQIKKWMDEDSQYSIFVDYVDFQIYPKYREQVPVGICLQTISDRLTNNYYSGILSLQHDINLIYENSLKFNGPNHMVTNFAQQLCNILLTLRNSQELPMPSNSKNSHEDSLSKKQKIIKQSEQIMQSFSNEPADHRRKTRRQDQQKLIKKRKIQSSDYEESSISPEHFSFAVSTRGNRTRNRNNYQEQPKRVTRSNARH